MEEVSRYIPLRARYRQTVLMPIEDVFTITGRGTVVTAGWKVSKVVTTFRLSGWRKKAADCITGVEMFRKTLDEGVAGDNIGVLLRGIDREDVERGQVLAKPGSIRPLTKFKGQVYVLTKEKADATRRSLTAIGLQLYFRTTDVTGTINLPEGVEMVMPGDNVVMDVELITPIAIEQGLRFAIREGGRTVGAGVVAEVFE